MRFEIFATPKLVTARRSILGLPAEGWPGPSCIKDSALVFIPNPLIHAMQVATKTHTFLVDLDTLSTIVSDLDFARFARGVFENKNMVKVA